MGDPTMSSLASVAPTAPQPGLVVLDGNSKRQTTQKPLQPNRSHTSKANGSHNTVRGGAKSASAARVRGSKLMAQRGGRGRAGGDNDPPTGKAGWWAASPLAVLGLGLTLALNVGQMGFTYAHVLAGLEANKLAITVVERQVADRINIVDRQAQDRDGAQFRLIEERHALAMKSVDDKFQQAIRVMDERYALMVKGIDRLELSMSSMMQLRTDVEVVKNKLTGIDETLRTFARAWDRAERTNNIPKTGR